MGRRKNLVKLLFDEVVAEEMDQVMQVIECVDWRVTCAQAIAPAKQRT